MSITLLLGEVCRCSICSEHLPHGPRPVLQIHSRARILVVGQAPGRKVHESGVPFADASGWAYPLKSSMTLNIWLFSQWAFVFQVLANLEIFRHVLSAHQFGMKNL